MKSANKGTSFIWFGNVACTLDSIIGTKERQLIISNEEDWRYVHNLRAKSAAIVIGSGTVLIDDPSVLLKEHYLEELPESYPHRVVFDRRGRLDSNFEIFGDQDISKTLWITKSSAEIPKVKKIKYTTLRETILKIEYELSRTHTNRKIMVEGGAILLSSLINYNILESLRIFRSSQIKVTGKKLFPMKIEPTLKLQSVSRMGDGIEEKYHIE